MTVLDLSDYGYYADLIDDSRPSIRASLIHELITKTPAHAKAKHPRLNPNLVLEEKHEFDIGTVSHALLLEGEAAVQIVAADSWRTKAAQESRDFARAHGKVPLLDKDWQAVQDITSEVRSQIESVADDPPPFTNGKAEQTLVWEERGVLCRARPDWIHDGSAVVDDYKTASSARPEKWSRVMFDYGCDTQAAFYLRGVRACYGVEARFRFVVVEKTPPYALTLFDLGPDVLELANRKIDHALDVWRKCLEADSWPAYPTRPCTITLPPWAEGQWFDREAREQVAA